MALFYSHHFYRSVEVNSWENFRSMGCSVAKFDYCSYVPYGFHERHLLPPLKDKNNGNSLMSYSICGSV